MKKTLFCLLLAALIAVISSCGIIVINRKSGTDTTSPFTDPETTRAETLPREEIPVDTRTSDSVKKDAEDALAGLDVVDMGGARILLCGTDLTFAEGDGEQTVLSSDRASRVAVLEKKFNAEISLIGFSEDELLSKLKDADKNGEYFADVIAVPARLVGQLVSDGLVKSLRTLPETKLSAPYFSADSVAAFSAGHGIYAVSGEGCFEPEKLYCVYFNKELFSQLDGDAYRLVNGGGFTLEEYARLSGLCEYAGIGFTLCEPGLDLKKALYLGSGLDFSENGVDMTPKALTFDERYGSVVSLLSSLPDAVQSDDPLSSFSSGGALFYIGTVADAEKISADAGAWGILPMPKHKDAAGYSAYLSDEATVLCVPVCNSDDRLSGDFIESFNACSTGYLKYDLVYHYMLDVLRDNGSVNVLSSLLDAGNYDFITSFASGYPTLYNNTVGAFYELVSGQLDFDEYRQREEDVRAYLEKWFPIKNK